MPLTSVPAVYDGKEIKLLEPSPAAEALPERRERLLRSLGAWQDDRPIEATLQDILSARRSRTEPPAL